MLIRDVRANYATLYLTRRNLLTLLSKLDRVKNGSQSERTIVKQDTAHAQYPCTHITTIVAVEDADYYTDREPGRALEADEPKHICDDVCRYGQFGG